MTKNIFNQTAVYVTVHSFLETVGHGSKERNRASRNAMMTQNEREVRSMEKGKMRFDHQKKKTTDHQICLLRNDHQKKETFDHQIFLMGNNHHRLRHAITKSISSERTKDF
jgi:hypothetical protein